MLLVYRTTTGEVVDNTGTNSVLPEGPPDPDAYVNTDAMGIARSELSLLRLHDVDDADLVAQVLAHEVTVVDGAVQIGAARSAAPLTDAVPGSQEQRIVNLESAVDQLILDSLMGP